MNSCIQALVPILLIALSVTGCGKEPDRPLSAAECKEMKEKQTSMALAEIKKTYGDSLTQAKVEVELDCDTLKEFGRIYYDCTMTSDTTAQMTTCIEGSAKQ